MFDNDALNAFMRQAGRHKLLTKDDEARLGAAILAGTEAAKELQTSGLAIHGPASSTVSLQTARQRRKP